MPPSQLKRLKASLKEQGVLGPQQSKKQKKQNAQNGINKEKRVNRKVALEGIREQFNPFDFKQVGRAPKWETTSMERKSAKVSRPGFTKSREVEARSAAIEDERRRRHKVGGILDRRFGENDPTMAPEDKMLERFTREKQKGHQKSSAFDLEDEDEPGELTHMGMSLSFDGPVVKDDFDEEDLELSDAGDHPPDQERHVRKRRHSDLEDDEEEEDDGNEVPERKKSKQEVMKELIAKSKLYKYERQNAKDEDEDLREELDQEMSSIHALLRGMAPKPKSAPTSDFQGMNPERAALLTCEDRVKFEKEYNLWMRQMAQDQRSKPTEKSKTEEQIVEERARKLQGLEAKRLRRMEGDAQSSDEEGVGDQIEDNGLEDDDFGLGAGIKVRPSMAERGFEDEDDFLIDDELVADGSDVEESDVELSDDDDLAVEEDEEDEEFLQGLLTEDEAKRPEFLTGANAPLPEDELPAKNGVNGNLAYNFACPQSHDELLDVTRKVHILDLPIVVQRIRALHDPKLKSENKTKLGKFATSLVEHISYLANRKPQPPFSVVETVIRHIHSMAKTFAVEIANAFRRHLESVHKLRSLFLTPGDLVIFTAIGTIFPTSDHFHQVVTPAILTMSRYLGLKIPQSLSDYATGAYLCILCLQYQRLSKRYIPEVMNFVANTLCILAPQKLSKVPGNFPFHEPKTSVRIESIQASSRKLRIYDCVDGDHSEEGDAELKLALLEANFNILNSAIDLWAEKAAFTEFFEPISKIVKHLGGKGCLSKFPNSTKVVHSQLLSKLATYLKDSQLKRRALELHHHRPLAIKTAIPKFEESFNPDRHYDPDKERTEAAKLKKEYKRERKGAIRELRKDARVVAVQSLREKRERDEAYEKKYKRLVAEIQGEEGHMKKEYEREKEWRKKGRK